MIIPLCLPATYTLVASDKKLKKSIIRTLAKGTRIYERI